VIKPKQYHCEIPTCGRPVQIRSTIKSGEYKGKKVCGSCKQKFDGKTVIQKPIKKFTKKNVEKRKEERKGLPEFFQTAISLLKLNPYCQNCGCKINVHLFPQNNIAHVLKKEKYKSVMANAFNYVFLCDSKDNNVDHSSCHYDFDNRVTERPLMPVFETVLARYEMFRDKVVEQGKEREIYENYL
jgi:hypothetical protein